MKKAYRVIIMLMLTSITHVWSAESDSEESLEINFLGEYSDALQLYLDTAAAEEDAEIAALIQQVQAPIQSATASAATSGNNATSKAFILPIYPNPLPTPLDDDSCVSLNRLTTTNVPSRTTRSQTNKKPFVCDCQVKINRGSLEMKKCGRSFASNEELIEHKVIHSSKPFVCEYKCGSSFSDNNSCKNHQVTCKKNPDLDADKQRKKRIKIKKSSATADVVLPIPVPLPSTITQEDINALQEKIDEVRERIQEIKRQKILNSIPIPSVPTVGEHDAQQHNNFLDSELDGEDE